MIEIRTLQYFLAVAREGSFTRAAALLHVSQPTLSRQIRALEEEYGKVFFNRTTQHVSLSSEGLLLRKYAEEILRIAGKADQELRGEESEVLGDVYIESGESLLAGRMMKAARAVQARYPGVHFHMITGDGTAALYDLDRGLVDFAFVYGDADPEMYESLPSGGCDRWCVVMRRDDPLAEKKAATPEDLWDKPLILSRNTLIRGAHGESLIQWFRRPLEELQVVNSYTMFFNGALMVREGMGYALTFEGLAGKNMADDLCMRPLAPAAVTAPSILWKKGGPLSAAARAFLKELKKEFAPSPPGENHNAEKPGQV